MTQVDDILYRADGTPARGTLVISWPAFVTPDKQSVAAGSKIVSLGSDGHLSVGLAPTVGSTPSGSVYKVIAKYSDGTTSTEFWAVPAAPTATIAQMRVTPAVSNTSVASQSAVAAKLDRSGDTPISLAGVRYASAFPGTSAPNKLDAAIANCGSNPCVVVAPSSLSTGFPTTLPDNVVLQDERQWATMNNWGLPDLGQHNGIIWHRRITSTNNGWDGYSTGQFYFEAAKGGHNNWDGVKLTKNTYYAFGTTTVSRTPGQLIANEFSAWNYSSGDTISAGFGARRYGGTLTLGDEGLEALRIDAGTGDQLFSASVASIDGNTITFAGATNASTLGETRFVINRNPAKSHSGTCTVNTTVAPPTITCSNATLATWYGGTGSKSNVCFELACAKVDQFNRTIGMRSINSETTATLDFSHQGGDTYWDQPSSGVCSSGAATFSSCSRATDASTWTNNKLTVADASGFAPGDALEQGVDPAQGFAGINILYYPSIWPATQTAGISITNAGARDGGTPTIPLYTYITTHGAATGKPGAKYMWTHWNGTVISGGISWHNESTTPPYYPWFYAWSDNTSGCELMLGSRNGANTNLGITMNYCRHPSNTGLRGWHIGAFTVTEDDRVMVSAGQWNGVNPNIAAQLEIVPSTNNDAVVAYNGWSSIGQAFKADGGSTGVGWQVDFAGNAKHFNSSKTTWYSDSGNTATARIDGSTGNAQFAKVCYNSALTLCDYAGAGAPSGSCATGSTYRRSDGSANSSFYVCEAGHWTAK